MITKMSYFGARLAVVLAAWLVSGVAHAGLTLGIEINPDPVRPNQLVRVQLTVTNPSDVPSGNVTVTATVPAGLDYFDPGAYTSGGATCSTYCNVGEVVTWTMAPLPARAGRTVSYTTTVQNAATAGTVITVAGQALENGSLADSTSDSVTVDTDNPLTLEVDESRDPVAAGDTLTYTLTYGNRSAGSVTAATLSFPLPAGTNFESATDGVTPSGGNVQWNIGLISPGQSGQRQVTVTVDEGLAPGALLSVDAAVLNGTAGLAAESAQSTSVTRVATSPTLNLALSLNPDPVRPNQLIRGALTVTNTGSALSDVALQVRVPGGLDYFNPSEYTSGVATCSTYCNVGELVTWNLGDLPAGSGKTLTFNTTVASSAVAGLLLTAEAFVTAGDQQQAVLDQTAAVDSNNALTLEVDESRNPVAAEGKLIYTLTYGNRESFSVTGATLSLPLPAGTTFNSATDNGIESDGLVTWDLGVLSPGQSAQRQVKLTVDSGTAAGSLLIVDAAMLSGTGASLVPELARATSAARVGSDPTLNLAVDLNPDPVRPNEWIRGALTVTNTGAPASDVKLQIRVPGGLDYFNPSEYTSGVVTCSTYCNVGELVTWSLGDLPAGSGKTVTFNTTVASSAVAGLLLTPEAFVTASDGRQAVLDQTGAVDNDNALTLVVDASRNPVRAGTDLTYVLTYGNRDDSAVSNAVLTFPVPVGTTFKSASGGEVAANGRVKWDIGTISGGGAGFHIVTVRVPDGTAVGTLLPVDAAQLTATGSVAEAARHTSSTRVVTATPRIRADVAVQAPNQPGQPMATQIKLTNSSGEQLADLIVEARVPAGVNYFLPTGATGPVTATCSTYCNVGELVTWTVPIVAVDQVLTFTISPVVASGLDDGQLIHVLALARELGQAQAVASDTVIIGPFADADLDGIPDHKEAEYNMNPNDASDAGGDRDGDGLTNIDEYFNGSNPNDRDTDNDDVEDKPDNCPLLANSDQVDEDFDRHGDVCDPDGDGRTSGPDTLTGTGRDETLNGLGGADTLKGKGGNDIYIVENVGDVVVEETNAGTDTVKASVTYTLPANVEKLILTGTNPINGTGNSLNNTLTGNASNNVLDGKAGADTMIGKAGNDTYLVDNAGDKVTESVDQGTDLVKSSVSFTLGANVENLTLTGTADRNGVGNELANKLVGNGGANKLNGKAGNDTLTGGAGLDHFLFTIAPNTSTNYDKITDFNVADDVMVLENAVFTGLTTTGPLALSAFVNGTAATKASHRIIYDKATGTLYYDRDGNGSAAKVRFALLTSATKPTLTYADFVVQ